MEGGTLSENEFAGAFRELQDEFNSTLGKKQEVKINGKKFEAIIEEIESDEVMAEGGEGDNGGFRCMIATTLMPKRPANDAEIEADGHPKFDVLSCVRTNGVTWTIVAGNKATNNE